MKEMLTGSRDNTFLEFTCVENKKSLSRNAKLTFFLIPALIKIVARILRDNTFQLNRYSQRTAYSCFSRKRGL